VSIRQNGVGPNKTCADAILPNGHDHSELFFKHCDPVKIAVWSAATAGDSERFAVRRERIFAAEVAPFGFPTAIETMREAVTRLERASNRSDFAANLSQSSGEKNVEHAK
jgi:hypothetical protein